MSDKESKGNRLNRREMLAQVKGWSLVALSLPATKIMLGAGVGTAALSEGCVYTDGTYHNYSNSYSNGYSNYSNYSDSSYSNYSNYSNYSD